MRVRSKGNIFSIIRFAYFVFPLSTLISLYFFSSFCLVYLRKCRCLFLSVRLRPLVSVSLLFHLHWRLSKFLKFYFPHVLAYLSYRNFVVQFVQFILVRAKRSSV